MTHRPKGFFSLWQVPQKSGDLTKSEYFVSWKGETDAFPRAVLDLARVEDVVEVERRVALEARDGVADVAEDGLVGPAAGRRQGRRRVADEERGRGVAAVAAGLDLGHLGILVRLGHGQLEVLDLVPVMGVGLGHHGRLPLGVDLLVALGAALGRLEQVVGLLLGRRGPDDEKDAEQDDGGPDGDLDGFSHDCLPRA